jgi:uncharacterized protein with FMN-binding domain
MSQYPPPPPRSNGTPRPTDDLTKEDWSVPIDPLLAQRLAARLEKTPDAHERGNERSTPDPSRRRHPARGARAVALIASLAATGGVATSLAASEGAFSDDDAEVESAQSSAGTAPSSIEPPASTDTSASATVDEPTASTSSVATTPPTTEPQVAVTDGAAETKPVTASSGYTDGVYLGTAEYTEWGDVQVEVTISGRDVVEVAAVQIPSGRKSATINDRAERLLEAQAIEMQAADLDIVSGATYTSRTYADSLQAALDQAALASSQLDEAGTS